MKRALAFVALLIVACSGKAAPSHGTYTIAFPSTAAAVATDFVQILVFDVADNRATLCEDLVTTRLTSPDDLVPSVNPPADPTNICELRAGVKPIDIPYGEHALLAIGQRRQGDTGGTKDFLIGCAIMKIGDGDAPVSIPVRLVNVNQPVPSTKCASVGDFCDSKCN
jgi:hypothetical protein